MGTLSKTSRKNKDTIKIPKHKRPVPKDELPIYRYVEERAGRLAKEIATIINKSPIDQGGIILIYGPLHSGKTLVGIELDKFLSDKRNMVKAQPDIDRSDIVKGYFYSKRGIKVRVKSFKNKQDLENLFDVYDVVVIDELAFIPYEIQSFVLREMKDFVKRGGWFIGIGLLYTGNGSEFLLTSSVKQIADKVYHLTATCKSCGRRNAVIGQRLVNGRPASIHDPELEPPSSKVYYEPRCRECFIVHS